MKWPEWTRRTPPGDTLYRRIVAAAREPAWYQAGMVPDTVDGRFDVVALVLALVLLRLEREDEGQFSADLTERSIADMDGFGIDEDDIDDDDDGGSDSNTNSAHSSRHRMPQAPRIVGKKKARSIELRDRRRAYN